jgi:hypothetical protein
MSWQAPDPDCSMNSLFDSDTALEERGGHQYRESMSWDSRNCSLMSLFESDTAMRSLSGHQHTKSDSTKGQDEACSLMSVFESKEASAIPGGHQQHQSASRFQYGESHGCSLDSILESETSEWDNSRDHTLEAEIVATYNLPAIPRTVNDIPSKQNGQPAEIDENDFAQSFAAHREDFENERKWWNAYGKQKACAEGGSKTCMWRTCSIARIRDESGRRRDRPNHPVMRRRGSRRRN